MDVKFVQITPEAEEMIVEIARVSSSRQDKREEPETLINYLIKNRHWSPFEHGFMTMRIVTSKSIAIQYLRHRSFTFQEFSQRYQEVEDFEDVELRMQATKNRQSSTLIIGDIKGVDWKVHTEPHSNAQTHHSALHSMADAMKEAQRVYKYMLKIGVARETARMILPMCTQTVMYMSGTIRSWIHLLDIRDDPHAQKEAQLIAKAMKVIFIQQCPIIAKARGWTE